MAVYTCSLLLKHHASGIYCARLWADTSDEALLAAYEVGATLDDLQRGTSWENYLITPDQQALAIFNGAKLTDYLEPRFQRAVREGDQGMIRSIEIARGDVERANAIRDKMQPRAIRNAFA